MSQGPRWGISLDVDDVLAADLTDRLLGALDVRGAPADRSAKVQAQIEKAIAQAVLLARRHPRGPARLQLVDAGDGEHAQVSVAHGAEHKTTTSMIVVGDVKPYEPPAPMPSVPTAAQMAAAGKPPPFGSLADASRLALKEAGGAGVGGAGVAMAPTGPLVFDTQPGGQPGAVAYRK